MKQLTSFIEEKKTKVQATQCYHIKATHQLTLLDETDSLDLTTKFLSAGCSAALILALISTFTAGVRLSSGLLTGIPLEDSVNPAAQAAAIGCGSRFSGDTFVAGAVIGLGTCFGGTLSGTKDGFDTVIEHY